MAGLERFVEILRLFDERKPHWTIQEMAVAVDVPASTVYRTVRELVGQGFLDPSLEAHYRLGAAFIEFDRRLRICDPLIREGEPILADVLQKSEIAGVAIIARLYRGQVICVAEARSPGAHIETSYERGRPMPMMRGATSKAILAQLPRARLNKILSASAEDHALQQDNIAALTAIRRQGYAITRGEVDSGLVGISVAISCPEVAINASMSLIIKGQASSGAIERRLLMTLMPAADLLAQKLRADPTGLAN
ncbi:IclR family transcriptional regulator [Allorhizobium taibaishanense]|uniref:DNA-binding IclR family transcriptional regulator n=1 Tax=Allorhizobium taibaishanense TaxID=887144 RepID=A0A1Q9A9C9_9HYPH|nr:helix-turn-helix domain-containing protein [Allorhizobium taibaishanense]MBB4009795.1 DNA-binding IclR family transcriptional regulator [Allorhizobium taibaishanense]OLP51442.1 hypothetical protein BJF91_15395 [Allorhizobium taibaishanense]